MFVRLRRKTNIRQPFDDDNAKKIYFWQSLKNVI